MSLVTVGDALELTFTTTPGAVVTVCWISPAGELVQNDAPVPESAGTPGAYLVTLLPSSPGVWEARFTARGTVTASESYYVRARPIGGPPPLATVGEVVEMFRPLTDAEQGLTKELLRRASHMVRTSVPRFAERLAAGQLDADTLGHAVINMVLRVLRNPGGLRAETVGPFSRTFDISAAAGLLVFTDAELAMLNPNTTAAAAAAATAFGTIRAGAGPLMSGWLRDDRRFGDRL
ncbi:hypothetical protein [Micromonospora sp. RV43]|uniref:hypothetical protein n=1 Tax=Micromonospora sp. RV43 TaxID=1661387 RepID=UPI00064BD7BE|nr:hypothetical protein [Micromonospora sp. RV43]